MNIEERLKQIEARNLKVEGDKAWETSTTRRVLITALTYAVVVIYLLIRRAPEPFLNALVPPIGFFLSTLALKAVKTRWLATRIKNHEVKEKL